MNVRTKAILIPYDRWPQARAPVSYLYATKRSSYFRLAPVTVVVSGDGGVVACDWLYPNPLSRFNTLQSLDI